MFVRLMRLKLMKIKLSAVSYCCKQRLIAEVDKTRDNISFAIFKNHELITSYMLLKYSNSILRIVI